MRIHGPSELFGHRAADRCDDECRRAKTIFGSVFHQPKLLADIQHSGRRIGGADADCNLGGTAMKTFLTLLLGAHPGQ